MKNLGQFIKKYVIWFQYQPLDEREQQLYYRAYMRSYQALVFLLIVFFGLFSSIQQDFVRSNNNSLLDVLVIVFIVISYTYGSLAFRGEELSFRKPVNFSYQSYWNVSPLFLLPIMIALFIFWAIVG